MVLYTPLHYEDVFPTEFAESKYIVYQGKLVSVSANKSGSYTINQLLSTDPQDYLETNFSPGTMVKQSYK